MKKLYNFIFKVSFIVITLGIIVMLISQYAIKYNINFASANANESIVKLAYVNNNKQVVILNLKDSTEVVIPKNFNEVFSLRFNQDRSKLIICGIENNISNIYEYDTNSKQIKPLIQADIKDKRIMFASISNDNQKLCYTISKTGDVFKCSNIAIYDIKSNKETLITNQDESSEVLFYYNYPQFTNDLKSIIYSKATILDEEVARYDSIYICQYDFASNTEAVLIGGKTIYDEQGNSSGFKASVPILSSDSKKIAFLKIIGNVDMQFSIYDIENKKVIDIFNEPTDFAMPTISLDFKLVAFEKESDNVGSPINEIYTYDIQTKNMKKVAIGFMPAL